MSSIIQVAQFAVTAGGWTILACRSSGSCLKAWFEFDADLHLRSDANDGTTDALLAISKGDQFEIAYAGPITVGQDRPFGYLQAASGTVHVTLFCIMQLQ